MRVGDRFIADQNSSSKYFNNLIVLDIDGDNKPELLVPEFPAGDDATAGIRVFKAGTDGKFAVHEFIATPCTETLEALDGDGDGKLDLVGSTRQATSRVGTGFQVLLRTTSGFTTLAPVALPEGGYEFGVVDFDQDGKRELIVNRTFALPTSYALKNELLIYSQGAAGVFSLNAPLTNGTIGFCTITNVDYCRNMKIVDLNGDGKPELVFGAQTKGNELTDNLVIAFNRQAGGGLIKNLQVAIGNSASVFAIQDMDGDGIADLVVVGSTGFFSIVGGGPNFSFEFSNKIRQPVVDTMYPASVAIGDIDGDGQPDIDVDSYNSGIVMSRHVKY